MRGRSFAMMFLLLAIALCSCGGSDITLMEDVNISSWREDIAIAFYNEEADAVYDLDLVLHVNSNYSTRSQQMILAATSPDSLSTSEVITVETPIIRRAPEASAKDIVIPYRRGVRMAQRGTYHYTLRPSTPLSGVESAGIIFKPQNR